MATGVFRRPPPRPRPARWIPTAAPTPAPTSLVVRLRRPPLARPRPRLPDRARFPFTAEEVVPPDTSLVFDRDAAARQRIASARRRREPAPSQFWIPTEAPTPPSTSLLWETTDSAGKARLVFRPRWRQPPLTQPWIGNLPPPAGTSLLWNPVSSRMKVLLAFRERWRHPPASQVWVGTITGLAFGDPEDPDDDIAFTGRLDRNGDSLVPPRPSLFWIMDDQREPGLKGPRRSVWARDSHRWVVAGSAGTVGHTARLVFEDYRAGIAGGLRAAVLTAQFDWDRGRRLAADTTARLDRNGDTVVPATCILWHAADDQREPALTRQATDQDRYFRSFVVSSGRRIGHAHRLVIEDDGRAGTAGGFRGAVLWADAKGDGKSRIPEVVS